MPRPTPSAAHATQFSTAITTFSWVMTTRNDRILSATLESPLLFIAVGNATRILIGRLDASAMMNALTRSTKNRFCSTFATDSTITSAKAI